MDTRENEIKKDFPHKKAIRAIRCAVTDDRSNSNSRRYAVEREKKANEMNGWSE